MAFLHFVKADLLFTNHSAVNLLKLDHYYTITQFLQLGFNFEITYGFSFEMLVVIMGVLLKMYAAFLPILFNIENVKLAINKIVIKLNANSLT